MRSHALLAVRVIAVVDEISSHIWFDGHGTSARVSSGMKTGRSRFGPRKSYQPGWRVGWAVAAARTARIRRRTTTDDLRTPPPQGRPYGARSAGCHTRAKASYARVGILLAGWSERLRSRRSGRLYVMADAVRWVARDAGRRVLVGEPGHRVPGSAIRGKRRRTRGCSLRRGRHARMAAERPQHGALRDMTDDDQCL